MASALGKRREERSGPKDTECIANCQEIIIFAVLNGKTLYMKYPIGMQTFEKLREEGCVYVDKTEYIYQLVNNGGCYFLSRPRRFGKSLLVSTLDAYFSGRQDLFRGLAIEELEKDWIEYPVLSFDMSVGKVVKSVDDLYSTVNKALADYEKIYGKDPAETNVELRFAGIIHRAYEKENRKVVILIDEYDKPLLDTIEDQEEHDRIRDFLKGFYINLKSQDKYIRFVFLTGVTKFSHVSIFSGLNNLKDISMDPRYSEICGITGEELNEYFKESIEALAAKLNETYDQTLEELEQRYDGYHFHQDSVGLYNPFSLLSALDVGEIGNYWFRTGTPTYLVNMLRKFDVLPTEIANIQSDADSIETLTDQIDDWVPLLYQSGYLTISGYDAATGLYTLDIPNGEVRSGLFRSLVPGYVGKNRRVSNVIMDKLSAALSDGRTDDAMQELKEAFSSLPHGTGTNTESNYQQIMAALLFGCGIIARIEEHTAQGRIDVIFDTKEYIYIFELKLDKSADEALRQIEDKDYAARYASDPRPVIKVGINFSSSTRSIAGWKIG